MNLLRLVMEGNTFARCTRSTKHLDLATWMGFGTTKSLRQASKGMQTAYEKSFPSAGYEPKGGVFTTPGEPGGLSLPVSPEGEAWTVDGSLC